MKRCNNKNAVHFSTLACIYILQPTHIVLDTQNTEPVQKFMAHRMALHYIFFLSLFFCYNNVSRNPLVCLPCHAIKNMQKSGAILEISSTLEMVRKCRCRKLSK